MVFALIAVGLIALAGIADFATEALEEGADELENRFDELRQDPRFERLLNLDDDISEEQLRDLLSTDEQENGMQISTNGDFAAEGVEQMQSPEILQSDQSDAPLHALNQDDERTGAGAETYQLAPDTNGVIMGFRSGIDALRVDVDASQLTQDDLPDLSWQITDNGVELHFATSEEGEPTADSLVVLLEGLTVPPPAQDITLRFLDDRQGDALSIAGNEINFGNTVQAVDEGDLFAEVNFGPDLPIEQPEGSIVHFLGENEEVNGSERVDLFKFSPSAGQPATFSTISDFDPEEDAILIELDQFYDGPGDVSTQLDEDGKGTMVQIDGQTALLLSHTIADLSSIAVVQL
jgi:hypothetical protein